MSEAESTKKPVNKRSVFVWVLFFVVVVLPSLLWAMFVIDQSFIHLADQSIFTDPSISTMGWFIRQIVIAFLPLTVSIYVAWRK
jgi:uncharacterized membrane protein YjgN (DUF898 family)